mgnify:CR=1 FL=1
MTENELILIDKHRISNVKAKVTEYEKSGCGIEHYIAIGYRQCLAELGIQKDSGDGHLQSKVHEK